MALLWWAPGEEIEFSRRGAGVITRIGGLKRSYVRGSLLLNNALAPGAIICDGIPLVTPLASLWMSAQFSALIHGDGYNSMWPVLGLASFSQAEGGLFVGAYSGSNTQLSLFMVTSAGVVSLLASEAGHNFTQNLLHRLDIQVTNWNNATIGNVKVWLDSASATSTPLINFTGNLSGSGFVNLDCVRAKAYTNDGNGDLSEIILADEDTRTFLGVASLAPSAAGTTNTFTSGTYADIDEAILDDADLISSDTNAQEFNCNLNDLPAGNFSIRGFKTTVRAACGVSGPTTLKLGINSGGTRNTVDKTLSTSLDTYERMMLVNPITGLRFTPTEINAIQLCLKSAA